MSTFAFRFRSQGTKKSSFFPKGPTIVSLVTTDYKYRDIPVFLPCVSSYG